MVNLHSILALTDFSPRGEVAVLRAALLAQQQRCLLKIMHAPPDLQGAVHADAWRGDVRRLASDIHTRFGILVKGVADSSGHFQAVAEEARWVDLLVVSQFWERSAQAFFCGQPVERLQRIVSCPILLARLEAIRSYQRMLVAIDSAPDSGKLSQMARSLGRNAELEPIHALDPTLKSKLHEEVVHDVELKQRHSNAELIVVGKNRRRGFSDFVFGSAAHRVLRWSKCDVLLVPHDLRIEPRPGLDAPSAAERVHATARNPMRSSG
ncbi:universal stress protein [Variovorax sp. OV329]|uniref:universal stress protein n=1 Tax=Variovorax sp. OV329 TaxID=1882825 RepID=UPI000B86A599|nr:universal stress protein [Variovorax sp. OV329]